MAKTRSFAYDLNFLTAISIARSRRVQYVLAALCGTVVALGALATEFVPPFLAAPFGIAMAIVGYAPQPLLMRKRLSHPLYRGLFRSRTLEVSEGKLSVLVDDGTRSEVPLTSIVSASFSRDHYFLLLSPDAYFIVPKEAWLSESDHQEFLTAVRAAIPHRSGF